MATVSPSGDWICSLEQHIQPFVILTFEQAFDFEILELLCQAASQWKTNKCKHK